MKSEFVQATWVLKHKLKDLLAAGIERLLLELELPVSGRLNDKKRRLRRHIGLMVL